MAGYCLGKETTDVYDSKETNQKLVSGFPNTSFFRYVNLTFVCTYNYM